MQKQKFENNSAFRYNKTPLKLCFSFYKIKQDTTNSLCYPSFLASNQNSQKLNACSSSSLRSTVYQYQFMTSLCNLLSVLVLILNKEEIHRNLIFFSSSQRVFRKWKRNELIFSKYST